MQRLCISVDSDSPMDFAPLVMEVIAKVVDTWRRENKQNSKKAIELIGRAVASYLKL
jgi:hypothetical protein